MALFRSSALILSGVLAALLFTSCGKKDKPQPPPNAQQAQAPKKAPKPVIEDSEEGSLVAKIPAKVENAEGAEAKVEVDDSNVSIDAEATSIAIETLPETIRPSTSFASLEREIRDV